MKRFILGAAVFACAIVCASVTAFADDHPWAKLKVGDWAKYKSEPAPGMVSETTNKVTKIEGKKVTYDVTSRVVMNGAQVSENTTTLTYEPTAGKGGAKGPKPKISDDTVEANGKKLKCKVYETEVSGKISKNWISADVPFGTVKAEYDGKVTLALVEWGRK